MSVLESIDLPGQPATGLNFFQPMGGDGYRAPLGRYECHISLAMDASGGTFRVTVNLDAQYMNIVAMMQLEQNIASDTTAFAMDVKLRAATNIYRVAGDLLQLDSAAASRLWLPPLMIDPVSIDFRLDNVDGDTAISTATVYCFKKGAQHVVPINFFADTLPRGTTVT